MGKPHEAYKRTECVYSESIVEITLTVPQLSLFFSNNLTDLGLASVCTMKACPLTPPPSVTLRFLMDTLKRVVDLLHLLIPPSQRWFPSNSEKHCGFYCLIAQ